MAVSVTDTANLLRRTGFGVTSARLAAIAALPSRDAAVDRVTECAGRCT